MDTRIDRSGAGGVGELAAVRSRRNRVLVAMIKFTTIIVMIVIGLGVIFFGFGNGGQSIGFRDLTGRGGFFAGGWKGFFSALCIVVASYRAWS
ncbi:hypothetical protein ACNKHX_23590 [Shigella flexneri]